MIIFSISLIGEGISYLFHLPIPGSIIGLILLRCRDVFGLGSGQTKLAIDSEWRDCIDVHQSTDDLYGRTFGQK